MMPLMDGYDTCRAIRKHPKFHDIPVLFLSVKHEKEEIKKAFEEVFKVKVEKINTMITRQGKKKAFIKLKPEYAAADVAVKLGMI